MTKFWWGFAAFAVFAACASPRPASTPASVPRSEHGQPPQQHAEHKHAEREDEAERADLFWALQRQPGGFAGAIERDQLRTPLNPDAYVPALNQIQSMSAMTVPRRADALDSTAQTATTAAWAALGPSNVGGRTRAFLIDPRNTSHFYAGGVGGGVWFSSDAGAHWTQTGSMAPNIAVSSLVMDPNDSNTLYAGTGEGFFNGDAIQGAGIFKTRDGGAHWLQLASTRSNDFKYVNKLIVSPHNSAVLYAATQDGSSFTGGVWRSTNGGVKWTKVLTPLGASGQPTVLGCLDLAVRTDRATDVVIASCGSFSDSFVATDTAAIYRNLDAAGTGAWTQVHSEAHMDRTSLAIAPSNQAVMYALAASSESGNFNLGLLAVLKSTDGGATWNATVRNTSPTPLNTLLLSNLEYNQCFSNQFFNQGWYDNAIAVDPVNPNIVWTGGVNLFRSNDGGANFQIASRWTTVRAADADNVSHADRHGIYFDPGYNGTSNQLLYVADDGGIQMSSNSRAATTASACNGSSNIVFQRLDTGYQTAQFYYGAVYPDGGSYFGGLQDNGTVRHQAATVDQSWDTLLGGDGGDVAIDPRNTNTLFGEFTGLSIQKSVDGGGSFDDATSGIAESGNNFLFIAPFTMAGSNPQLLWTGGRTLWRTTNQAASWAQASAQLPTNNGAIAAIAIAGTNANAVLAGTTAGYILSSSSALSSGPGTAWNSVQLPGGGYISAISYGPDNARVAYATISSFGSQHIFKTVDNGASWASIDGSGASAIPDVPVNSVLVDPNDSRVLLLGSDIGVFISLNGGASWKSMNAGLGNVAVRQLVYNAATDKVFAFTHGLGAYSIDLPSTAPPGFSPAAGRYIGTKTVTLTDATSGAAIYYTLDGRKPTTAATRYTEPISIAATTTIKAFAASAGLANSSVVSATYTIAAAPPRFSPAGGTYTTAPSVTISDSTSGASIYYTLDGSAPSTASTRYTAPISIAQSATLKAFAVAPGLARSVIVSAGYTIQ